MHVALPELHSPATLILDRENPPGIEDYVAFCEANPDLRLERTARGEIVIVPPAGGESDYRCVQAIERLNAFARRTGRGKAFGSSAEFLLPNGAALSPDAAWVSNERLAALSKAERRRFLRLVPEFVVEVMSPSDRLPAAREKMREWIANGVELGWLIDGDEKTVYVFAPNREPLRLTGLEAIAGEGPVDGFVLDLSSIWEGL